MEVTVDQRKSGKKGKKSNKDKLRIGLDGFPMMPGRNRCNCEGRMHKVLGNCLNCGRIICEQESYGPCMFCKYLVEPVGYGRKDESKEFEKAMSNRDKLLEYNQMSKNQIIDDQQDYYQSESNMWLSDEQKEEMQKKEQRLKEIKHEKKKLRFIIDFQNRQILAEDNEDLRKEQERLQKELSTVETVHSNRISNPKFNTSKLNIKKYLKQKQFLGAIVPESSFSIVDNDYFDEDIDTFVPNVVYNHPSRNSDDNGLCMSMHQPWATLLIAGIKQSEGRSWTSEHRGRLWIASTQRETTDEEIEIVLNQYREMGFSNFPKFYPRGVLLGACDVVDICTQDTYLQKYPKAQHSDCDHVFIIENPRPLTFPLSILGQPKIFKLDKTLHKAALAGLSPIPCADGMD